MGSGREGSATEQADQADQKVGPGGDAPALSSSIAGGSGVQLGAHNTQVNVYAPAGSGTEHGRTGSSGVPVVWPVRVGRAPLLADAFQDRPALSGAVGAAWASGAPAVVTQVVAGGGGTGKTQLAASVFWQALPGLDVALWVSATSRQAVRASFAQAWGQVAGGGGGDGERDAAAFLSWLETTDRSWLVVLDDLVNPTDVVGLWPQGRAGRVLVTSRRRDAALTGHGRVLVDVEVFAPSEAVEFLTRKLAASHVPSVLDEAEGLAEDLGFLPLALAQAGAVILDGALTCREYRRQFADRTRRLIDLFDADPGDGYERTVARTWALAAERADELSPKGLAGRVLDVAAVLDCNGFPDGLLTTPAVLSYLAHQASRDCDGGRLQPLSGAPSVTSPEDARRAVRNLHRLSLVIHDPSGGGRAVRMHGLAQRATREHLSTPDLAATVRAAADGLLQVWPVTEPDPEVAQALRSNGTKLSRRDPDALWAPAGPHPVLFRIGGSFAQCGQVGQARDYFARLAEESAQRLGADHIDTLTARFEHVRWGGVLGDVAGAVCGIQVLLADRERVLGEDHRDTLVTRHELAYWRGKAGDAIGARAEFARLLAEEERVLGPEHLDTLETRLELANWHGECGDAGTRGRRSRSFSGCWPTRSACSEQSTRRR